MCHADFVPEEQYAFLTNQTAAQDKVPNKRIRQLS